MASVSSVQKQFRRIHQAANENFGLRNKTEELNADIEMLGNSVDGIKNAFQMTSRKVPSLCQGSGSTHEKRRNKLPLVNLANGMQESAAKIYAESEDLERFYPQTKGSILARTLEMCSNVEHTLATNQADLELALEHQVVRSCNELLDKDIHLLEKSRKKLRNSRLDMDAARSKMTSMEKLQLQNPSPANLGKLDAATFECDETYTKFEHTQDDYATTLLLFLSKQTEHANIYRTMMERQLEYHRKCLDSLETVMPSLAANIDNFPLRPVFGTPLDEHLRVTNRKISLVLEECVKYLRDYNYLDTEGLLRKTGGTAKTKHLKASLDAGVGNSNYFSLHQADPHTIASLMKTYLRELPQPLLTCEYFAEWMRAAQVENPAERQKALFNVLDQLPPANFSNFRFLIEFLSELKQYSDENKMSSANIAIVVAPNILWPPGSESGANPVHTSLASRIVESFIDNYQQYFSTSNWSVTSPDTPDNSYLYAEVNKTPLVKTPSRSPPVPAPAPVPTTQSNGEYQPTYDTPYTDTPSSLNPPAPIVAKPKLKAKPERQPPNTPQAYRISSPLQAQVYPAAPSSPSATNSSQAPVPLPRSSSAGRGVAATNLTRPPAPNPQQAEFQSKIKGRFVV